jgi:ribosomal protein S18 acetylase RimI-like enzyme
VTLMPDREWAVRHYRESDWEAVYDICIKTGDSGDDVSGRFSNDSLFPDIWAGPYLRLEPELAYVLESQGRPVGYVLGTADTASFVKRYRTEWLPVVAPHYPKPVEPATTAETQLVTILFHPEVMLVPEHERYPAHLHIDILAGHRHGGAGRCLIENFIQGARKRGASGVHVGVAIKNVDALGFYHKIGFQDIRTNDTNSAIYLAMPLTTPAQDS